MRPTAIACALVLAACHPSPRAPVPAAVVAAPAPDDPAAAPGDPAEAALHALASALTVVRAPGDQPVRSSPAADLRALPGVRAARIRAALGEPNLRQGGEWDYSFYRLAPGSVGGGLELVVQIDAAGVCTAATWRHSQ
jgi:hypothetical protein